MSKDDIEAEFEREMKKIQQAKTDTEEQEDLKPQMEDFLKVRPYIGHSQTNLPHSVTFVNDDCTVGLSLS